VCSQQGLQPAPTAPPRHLRAARVPRQSADGHVFPLIRVTVTQRPAQRCLPVTDSEPGEPEVACRRLGPGPGSRYPSRCGSPSGKCYSRVGSRAAFRVAASFRRGQRPSVRRQSGRRTAPGPAPAAPAPAPCDVESDSECESESPHGHGG
jgi:hypothetical protein